MNILVVIAHLDDETFGMIGTLKKLAKSNNVHVLSMCKGRNSDITPRLKTAFKLAEKYNYTLTCEGYIDLELYKLQPSKISNIIHQKIKEIGADIVYCTGQDLHTEHEIINRCTKVAVRNTTVTELLEIFIPGSSDFKCNVFRNIDVIEKLKDCKLYNTEISDVLIEHIEYYTKLNGETFNLVFKKI